MNKKVNFTTSRIVLILVLLLAGQTIITRTAQATTYTVTNTNDSGAGSLRQSIIDSNNNPNPDIIAFNIPLSDPGYNVVSDVWLIQPTTLLPSLTGGATTIDGFTQTVNQGDTNALGPEVLIDGIALSSTSWIFSVESKDNVIKGLTITRAGGAGIKIISTAKDNTITENYIGIDPTGAAAWGNGTGIDIFGSATTNTISGNVISGNTLDGIKIAGTGTDFNTVKNNIIGLDPSGNVPIPNNRHGVMILNGPKYNSIGGDNPYRNIISGNGEYGVYISGIGTDQNLVWYNYIGTDVSGSADRGNALSGVILNDGATSNGIQENLISGNDQHGVYITGSGTNNNRVRLNIIGADAEITKLISNGWHNVAVYNDAESNWIGTISPPWGNVIVGASWTGVAIFNSNQNSVMYNAIGTDETGTATNLGNNSYGIHVEGMNNTIGISNTIAFNTLDGIRVDGKTVTAQSNPISQNSIFSNGGLGIELWSNGNTELNVPTITSASCQQIEGTTCAGCIVEIFSDTADEGKIFEGTASANAVLPAFSWSGTVSGPNVTATSTDHQGNTSEFSAPFGGLSCNSPIATVSVTPTSGPPTTVFRFDASGSTDIEDPTSALEVRWDWEDDGTYDTPWSTTKVINHTFSTIGNHFIRLQVRDTDGMTDSIDQLVKVVSLGQFQPLFIPLVLHKHP
jgi:parallel beta-helix repeat protein